MSEKDLSNMSRGEVIKAGGMVMDVGSTIAWGSNCTETRKFDDDNPCAVRELATAIEQQRIDLPIVPSSIVTRNRILNTHKPVRNDNKGYIGVSISCLDCKGRELNSRGFILLYDTPLSQNEL